MKKIHKLAARKRIHATADQVKLTKDVILQHPDLTEKLADFEKEFLRRERAAELIQPEFDIPHSLITEEFI